MRVCPIFRQITIEQPKYVIARTGRAFDKNASLFDTYLNAHPQLSNSLKRVVEIYQSCTKKKIGDSLSEEEDTYDHEDNDEDYNKSNSVVTRARWDKNTNINQNQLQHRKKNKAKNEPSDGLRLDNANLNKLEETQSPAGQGKVIAVQHWLSTLQPPSIDFR